MTGLLAQLFFTFFFIGLFNFGGGGAMLSLIQGQVVTAHGWISQEMFTDIVAISQTTPGPIGINCATYTGYEVMYGAGYGQLAGMFGSALATFAVVPWALKYVTRILIINTPLIGFVPVPACHRVRSRPCGRPAAGPPPGFC